jgi:coenzyme F420 hydrogenase subunit beta
MKSFKELENDVIRAGLCTGCGTCVGVCPLGSLKINYYLGEPQPELSGDCNNCGICYEVCPGRDIPIPALEKVVFGRKREPDKEDKLGIYVRCLKGFAVDKVIRENSSSGGVTTALFAYALDEHILDGVLLAGFSKKQPWRCQPFLATTAEDFVTLKANTAMVMVPVNLLLREAIVHRKLKKIGVVGCPCHIHGLRKIQMVNKPRNIAKSIIFTVGLFCSSNYYFAGTEHLVKEVGNISSWEEVIKMDYRAGPWPGSLIAKTKDGKIVDIASKHDYTYHFLGATTYKRDRCLMCVDFSSELADVSVGDVFTPEKTNPRWTAMLVRTEMGDKIINEAIEKGYIEVRDYDPQVILASGLGWEAKKHANVYRLLQRKMYGWPTPNFGYDLKCEPIRRRFFFP